MKKIKKVLALVMTIAMLAGMFVFAGPSASAALFEPENTAPMRYSDHDSINRDYEQAIQIFSKMRVIEGNNNAFDPKRDLTRAEAAAIIARTLISRDAADILGSNTAPFNDVPAGRWDSGPIAFAQNRGLISGMGDGSFQPGAQLTKAQWLKILLCSIGYGANKEFEGAGWAARVFEAASNPDVDLFGRYDSEASYWNEDADGVLQEVLVAALKIPEGGLDDFVTREEAIALLFNAVIIARKVVYDRAADVYTSGTSSAGLSGANVRFISDDIALRPFNNDPRDIYGRPENWTREWAYRNEWIYSHPRATPNLLETYRGNQTGNQIRQALQGTIGNLTTLQLTNRVDLFTNGHYNLSHWTNTVDMYNAAGDLVNPAFSIYISTRFNQANAVSSTNVNDNPTRPVADGGTGPIANYDVNGIRVDDVTYVWRNGMGVLTNYLTAKGNDVAFGPAVTVEIYEHVARQEVNKRIDVVIVVPYLAQLTRKVANDPATILLDETSLQFNVFNTVNGTQLSEAISYARTRSILPLTLRNFQSLYDNAAVNSYHLSTPYVRLIENPDVAFRFVKGHLLPIRPPDKPSTTDGARYRIDNLNVRDINEIYEADRVSTVTGVASSLSITRLTISGSTYDRALLSPTVRTGDLTNNYTYYLDENNVVVGAVYTAPGTANVSGFLWLDRAEGVHRGDLMPQTAWAKAEVVLATGRSATVNLLTTTTGGVTLADGRRGGQFWNPAGNGGWSDLLGAYDPDVGLSLLGGSFQPGFYTYTLVDGMYRLSTPSIEYFVEIIGNTSIRRGETEIGMALDVNGNLRLITATSRTILTVVDGRGARTFTGFGNFPTTIEFPAPGRTLVRLEPDSNRAAEILYIDTTTQMTAPVMYAYLITGSIKEEANNVWKATFIGDDGNFYRDLVVSNGGSGVLDQSLFFELTEQALDGEWTARAITTASRTSLANPQATMQLISGYTTGQFYRDSFELDFFQGGNSINTTWYNFDETGTQIIGVGFGEEKENLGKDGEIALLSKFRLIVLIYLRSPDGNESKVAFVFGENVGRVDIAGLN